MYALLFPNQSQNLEEIRKIFFDESAEIEEDFKYGGIVFNLSDELIGGIFIYKNHLSVEFSNGAQFSDNDGFLEGKGKMRRHLKILEGNPIKDKRLRFYIQQAVNPE